MRRASLKYALPVGLLIVLLAGGAFAAIETDTVDTYWEGLWWALSLVSTVGFAGETPHTVGGRIVSAILMILGFVLLALVTAAVASLFVEEEEQPAEERHRDFEREALLELRALRERIEGLERRL